MEDEIKIKEKNTSNFRSYGKIHRLGKEETEGILKGNCFVQEKIDGANVSVWIDSNGEMKMGSRTRILGNEEFNGFVPYVKKHEGVKKILSEHPKWRLYLEWLVRHTIAYKETAYKKAYLFDIFDQETGKYLPHDRVLSLAKQYEIETVPFHGKFENPTVEQLTEFVGKTEFGDRGEGIVIKNLDFVNTFGDQAFAKIVTESFKEDNGIMFGGNNKHSDTYYEMYVVNKYMTLPRVKKIMDKIQPEINEKLSMKDVPRVMNSAYHDMLSEEIWSIQKDVPRVDFKSLHRVATRKAKMIFISIINDDISVADKKHE
mgnify:FL=1